MMWYHQRKREWLERCGLRDHEEWPLFGVEKQISQAGQVWVLLTGLPHFHGRPDVLRVLLQDMRRLERQCEQEGIVGWLQAIKKGNWRMRRWTEMIGAELYAETEDHWHFRKEADVATLPKTLKALVSSYGGHHYGAA